MKCGISTSYSAVSHRTKRSKAAASRGPHVVRISSVIASRPWRTWMTEPSAKLARYIGSTGCSVSMSAMSAPAAANVCSSNDGIVRTVGPVSNR